MFYKILLVLTLLLFLSACSSDFKESLPKVSATQQILLSTAEVKAVKSILYTIGNKPTFINSEYFTGSKYELGLLSEYLQKSGTPIVNSAKDADVILTIVSSVDSINNKSRLIGIPSIPLNPELILPGIKIYSKDHYAAIAQFTITAYDIKQKKLLEFASSKYGVSFYDITSAFWFTKDYPHINKKDIAQ